MNYLVIGALVSSIALLLFYIAKDILNAIELERLKAGWEFERASLVRQRDHAEEQRKYWFESLQKSEEFIQKLLKRKRVRDVVAVVERQGK